MKINITVNSELFSLNEPQSLASFMKTWGREGPHAVAINNQFVPKTQYDETHLKDGDALEVVSPMQGG